MSKPYKIFAEHLDGKTLHQFREAIQADRHDVIAHVRPIVNVKG